MAINAYNLLTGLWNASVAADRFLDLVSFIKGSRCSLSYESGPCSPAEIHICK